MQRPVLYPFLVVSIKMTQLVYLGRQELSDVLSVYEGADSDHVCSVLQAEFNMCWDTLKPRGASAELGPGWMEHRVGPARGVGAAALQKQADEIDELQVTSSVDLIDGIHSF